MSAAFIALQLCASRVAPALSAGPVLALPAPALAPPLFVSAFEWLSAGSDGLASGARRCALVIGAALAGSLAALVMPDPLAAGISGQRCRAGARTPLQRQPRGASTRSRRRRTS